MTKIQRSHVEKSTERLHHGVSLQPLTKGIRPQCGVDTPFRPRFSVYLVTIAWDDLQLDNAKLWGEKARMLDAD